MVDDTRSSSADVDVEASSCFYLIHSTLSSVYSLKVNHESSFLTLEIVVK